MYASEQGILNEQMNVQIAAFGFPALLPKGIAVSCFYFFEGGFYLELK